MNINDFKNRLVAGGARPNQFRVQLVWPTGISVPTDTAADILISGAAIPASTVNPVITQYRGREVKFAGERIFDPWTITIINDAKQSLRAPFESWMELMNNKDDNGGTLACSSNQILKRIGSDRSDGLLIGSVGAGAMSVTQRPGFFLHIFFCVCFALLFAYWPTCVRRAAPPAEQVAT